jgi:hypothetical protein
LTLKGMVVLLWMHPDQGAASEWYTVSPLYPILPQNVKPGPNRADAAPVLPS